MPHQVISDSHLARAFVMGVRSPLATEPCPDADELWAALDPDLAPSQNRYRVLNHCARCPSCAQDLQVTKSFIKDDQQSKLELLDRDEHPPATRWPSVVRKETARSHRPMAHEQSEEPGASVTPLHQRKSWIAGAGVMGGLAIAAALALVFLPNQERNQDHITYRGGSPSMIELSAKDLQSGPPDVSQYHYRANHFTWPKSAMTAVSYTLTIVDAQFQARCSIENISRPEVRVNGENCPGFDPSQPFYWQVHTLLGGGKETRSSFVSQLPKRGS